MTIFPKVDVNVCKSDKCKNFTLPSQPEYIIPSYNLGYPAIYCASCGSNSLIVSNEDVENLLHPYFYFKNVMKCCPEYWRVDKIKYGITKTGSIRYQCKECKKVYSTWNIRENPVSFSKLLYMLFNNAKISDIICYLDMSPMKFYRELEKVDTYLEMRIRSLENITFNKKHRCFETNLIKLKCRNENHTGLSNELLGLISCCGYSGYVFISTLNWTDLRIKNISIYNHLASTKNNHYYTNSISSVYEKYNEFNMRPSFDQVQYSQKICSKKVIEPIAISHVHFQKLKFIHPCSSIVHYLHHDVFIRAGCMTAYGIEIWERKCDVFYVLDVDEHLSSNYFYNGSYKIGWWNNIWYEYINLEKNKSKYICNLSNSGGFIPEKYIESPFSLCFSRKFIRCFEIYFPKERIAGISPKNIIIILSLFEKFYNFCLPIDCSSVSPAQKNKLVFKILNIDELLNL
ncbi:hypothetical protein RRM29_003696 [Salmonella enterica]|nr:hypothetical protein [Salmonella enterica]EIF8219184.1 hypothetical protein [Salmonella enterica]ELI6263342.1 hypothetical protein [Salmonella enterica]ELI6402612.1 hypothetical protein [Salmonella enterica]